MDNDFLDSCHIQTKALYIGYEVESDIMQPIHLSTTFQRRNQDEVGDYTRSGNPNRTALEKKLSMLEGGSEAIAFASGMAAINGIFEVALKAGDHLVYPDDCYHGTRGLIKNFLQPKGVDVTEVDMTSVKNVAAAITSRTKLIWIESPSNPKLKITDIEEVVRMARERKIATGCDSTFATPLLQHPLALGVDFVMHSSTKFFSGHSDVLGGVVILKEKSEVAEKLRQYQIIGGAVPSPFDCWLLNRSLSTFALRVPVQNSNAMAMALYLSQHPKIEEVLYPGLSNHKNHDIAKRQMHGGFGSVLSILVKGGQADALRLTGNLKMIRHATSLGGVETLIEHRRSAEGKLQMSPDNLLRISAGIEHHDDLMRDLRQALESHEGAD